MYEQGRGRAQGGARIEELNGFVATAETRECLPSLFFAKHGPVSCVACVELFYFTVYLQFILYLSISIFCSLYTHHVVELEDCLTY